MSRVIVTPRADADLQEIWLYIAPANVDAADRVLDGIGSKLLQLDEHPQMGVARPDIAEEMRIFPTGHYFIMYRILGDVVEIVRIVDERRDLPNLDLF